MLITVKRQEKGREDIICPDKDFNYKFYYQTWLSYLNLHVHVIVKSVNPQSW